MFLTTHYMDEADRVAHRIAVIDHGRIVAIGSSAELKARTSTTTLRSSSGRGRGATCSSWRPA